MNLAERKRKYMPKKEPDTLRFNLGLDTMNAFCSYVLSDNKSIHRSSLQQMKELLTTLNMSVFNGDSECIERYYICLAGIECKLDKKMTNRNLIIRDIYGMVGDKFNIDPENFEELSNSEVNWVEQCISNCSNMSFINNSAYTMQSACMDYINCDLSEKEKYARKLQELTCAMNGKFRQNTVDADTKDNEFRLSDLDNGMHDTMERMHSKSYRLRTGIQNLNDVLNGGFEGSRVYTFFALPGEGKTTTLVNIAKQIKLCNRNYECKDPTKRPCIVFLTMENKVPEMINTLFSSVCTDGSLEEYTEEEAAQIMRSRGLGVTDDNPIEIIFRYKPINSVDTNYLYTLTEDLEDEGYEIVAFIQDYIKRIRPVFGNNLEERFRLGSVINEFRNFACFKDIPVITASQLNREAAKIIDECRDSKKMDLVKRLGRANIGESSLIDENTDASIFLAPEYDENNHKFMGVKVGKTRYRISDDCLKTFYIPYVGDSRVMMCMDINEERASVSSLMPSSPEKLFKTFGNAKVVHSRLRFEHEEPEEDPVVPRKGKTIEEVNANIDAEIDRMAAKPTTPDKIVAITLKQNIALTLVTKKIA